MFWFNLLYLWRIWSVCWGWCILLFRERWLLLLWTGTSDLGEYQPATHAPLRSTSKTHDSVQQTECTAWRKNKTKQARLTYFMEESMDQSVNRWVDERIVDIHVQAHWKQVPKHIFPGAELYNTSFTWECKSHGFKPHLRSLKDHCCTFESTFTLYFCWIQRIP